MDRRLHEINALSEYLEAEATGRPFDRRQASDLAASLAERLPAIRDTMRQISERLTPVGI